MQKIMFNDRYGLTDAVIEGRKIMTRRLADPKRKYEELRLWQPCLELECGLYGYTEDDGWEYIEPRYARGEIVAVAQSYYNAFSSRCDIPVYGADRTPGWLNKLFVRADLMPHKIQITRVKCERLQDISDADCMKEGVRVEFAKNGMPMYYYFDTKRWREVWFDTPREAFASLIDRISGKGTWKSNPWVVVYEFKLVK